jgi:RNase adaptor protein for sRNA GlmZ degradation
MAPFSPGTTRSWVGTGFERQVVSALRGRADPVIDTSLLTAADLKRSLIGHVAFDALGLRVFVTFFAYRHGIPRMPI